MEHTPRTPCLNPRCGRTFKQERVGEEVVCGKCWRALPVRLTRRHKMLRARNRKLDRLAKRKRKGERATPRQLWRIGMMYDRAWEKNWQEIRAQFVGDEKPEGMDAFLEEMGL